MKEEISNEKRRLQTKDMTSNQKKIFETKRKDFENEKEVFEKRASNERHDFK